MSNILYLSPSTQEDNRLYVNNKFKYISEEQLMNHIVDFIMPILRSIGFVVFRNKPEMSLEQVVEDSNKIYTKYSNGINVIRHIAFHSNAGGGTGCEVFCHKFKDSKGNESLGYSLAKSVYDSVTSIMPMKGRGVQQGYNYYGGKPMYELANTKAVATLIEIIFHDNPDDMAWLYNNFEVLCNKLIIGICDDFKIWYVPKIVTDYKVKYEALLEKLSVTVEALKKIMMGA